jgi:hypothetical protein
MNIDFTWGSPATVFGFIIAIVLINGIVSVLRNKAKQETIREAIRSGKFDEATVKSIADREEGDGDTTLAGFILIAVAAALVFFAYQIGSLDEDEGLVTIFLGIAAFPAFIGVVLLIAGLLRRGRKDR